MKRSLTAAIVALFGLVASASAVDPDYTFKESIRTGVVSVIYGTQVAFPGNVTVVGNHSVTGNAAVVGTLAVTGASTLTGAATLPAGITGGVSGSNVFYTVAAGTANCLTNYLDIRGGIVTNDTIANR